MRSSPLNPEERPEGYMGDGIRWDSPGIQRILDAFHKALTLTLTLTLALTLILFPYRKATEVQHKEADEAKQEYERTEKAALSLEKASNHGEDP